MADIGIVHHGMKGGTRGVIRNAPPARGTGRWGGLFALGHGDGGANTCSGVIGSRLCHHGDGVVSGGQVSRNGHIDDVCSRPSEF